ncbi:MAG: YceI family protein [Bacteroidales bacterium]|jgi:polyisoprenoid-binding protein YceI|nr:YceI family protein [Bacteroidales bacterium]
MKKINVLLAILLIGFTAVAQEFSVNTLKSELKWTGKKVTGEHWGFINLKDGSITLKNDKTLVGVFHIDMNSINNKDLEDPEWNGKLVGHLKSDDFFSVENFSVATLKITESTPLKDNAADVTGELTIKGITHPIAFKTMKTETGYSASISIDRTKYDIRYGSGKFFDSLGDNMIYDEFILDVNLSIE